ncbi:MAG: hypothetical protein ABL967_03455 [Bryobacteraceae bacterium]
MALMTGPDQHVLLWVAPEFLQSPGIIRILEQVGALDLKSGEAEEVMEAAAKSGGFALSGELVDAHHGAGMWIAPGDSKSLRLMIPWAFVRCTVLAEAPQSSKIFGLAADLSPRSNGKSSSEPGDKD